MTATQTLMINVAGTTVVREDILLEFSQCFRQKQETDGLICHDINMPYCST